MLAETPVQDLWPDLQTIRIVDELLQKRWFLDFKPDDFAIREQFPDIDDALHRFEDANAKAAAKGRTLRSHRRAGIVPAARSSWRFRT
jgi:hypothetical protein